MKNSIIISLIVLLLCSCEKDIDDNSIIPIINNPVTKNTPLYNDLVDLAEGELACVNFIYPFQILTFDQFDNEIASTTIFDTLAFLNFLTSLNDNHTISLSFPIIATNSSGEPFEVNSNEELAMAIKICRDEIRTGNAGALFGSCVWKFSQENDTVGLPYINGVFNADDDEALTFYHQGEHYRGTWIFVVIDDELYLNINLNDTSIGADLNVNWKVETELDNIFILANEAGETITLNKICALCEENPLLLTSCEIDTIPGTGAFVLATQVNCIFDTLDITDSRHYELSFHESMIDATTNVDMITSNTYYSITTTVYVRVENTITNTFEIIELNLVVEAC